MSRAFQWPLTALWVWGGAWALALALKALQAPWWLCVGAPTLMGLAVALVPRVASSRSRQVWVAAGFPLSLAALMQGGSVDAMWWGLPLAIMLLVYPLGAWRDAPMVPTPRGALQQLPTVASLPAASARILDAGCGMGHALRELHRVYPQAQCDAIERSALWRFIASRWCPFARVHQGDMWAFSWAAYDLVYLYQRPESMWRAWCKANTEMRPRAWLVSLDYPVIRPSGEPVRAHTHLTLPTGRVVWVYRTSSANRT